MSRSNLIFSETSDISNLYSLPFSSPRVRTINRIGPHTQNIYSMIFESLLSYGHIVKEKFSSRVIFYHGDVNSAYLL